MKQTSAAPRPAKPGIPQGFVEYMDVQTVAAILAISSDTVTRKFVDLDGVIDIGVGERMHKRRKRCLRIPPATLERYIRDHQARRRH